jgi:hypothetical protein
MYCGFIKSYLFLLIFFVRFLNLSLKTRGPYVGDARMYLGPGDYLDVRRSASRGTQGAARDARGTRSPVGGVTFWRIGDEGLKGVRDVRRFSVSR